MDLEKLSNILGADTVKKIYDDGLSGPVQEASKIAVDILKTFRLFTAPFQLAAANQDRLVKYLDRVRNSVPEENQIEAPASLSGPIIERLKYLEEDNYLTDLYLNLLSRAINKERVNEAHPAFFHLIDQLSPDEAMLLLLIQQQMFIRYDCDFISVHTEKEHYWEQRVVQETIPKEKLVFAENFEMYVEHLSALNLVTWWKKEMDVDTKSYISTISLNKFGALFVKACVVN